MAKSARKDYSLDQIGKRLSGKGLTPHEQVLAADDAVRVQWVLDQVRYRTVVDIGASDGAFTRRLVRQGRRVYVRQGRRVYAIERHPAHRDALATSGAWLWLGEADAGLRALGPCGDRSDALCCEVLEHLSAAEGRRLVQAVRTRRLIVTVPNRHCRSFTAAKRDRADYPDHVRDFSATSLEAWLLTCGWQVQGGVQPIIGTLNDSVWLGAVCVRA
jgi:hypothetical protein